MYMFSFLRRNRNEAPETGKTPEAVTASVVPETDLSLIAVLTAAIARFRESDGSAHSDAGFVVKRVRRI